MCLMRNLAYHRHTLSLQTAIKDERVSKEKGKANYDDAQPQSGSRTRPTEERAYSTLVRSLA
jgi:hypothetical protein